MKKITLILLCLSVTSYSFSQRTSAGIKAGANFSTLSNSSAESLTGLNAGGFFVHSIDEHFGVSIDLLYSGEGAKFSTLDIDGNESISIENKLRLNYLRVPLLANVFFGSLGDRLRPKISLGPSFGFLLSVKNEATATITEGSTTTVASYKNTSKDGYAGFDLSAIIGAGLNYRVSDNTWLNLDARYSIGATDINEVSTSDAVKNDVFSVSLGLAFGLAE